MVGVDNDCCRLERYKYALYRKFNEPRLYRLAAKGDWGPIPQRCRTHPKEAEFIHKYAPSDTALHQILRFPSLDLDVDAQECLKKVKHEAISALIATHPPIASVADSFWRLPLHLACMDISSPCGEQVCEMVLEAWPKAAASQDMEGRTPLHYLVARNEHIPPSLLEKLVAACPAALSMKDLVKETPYDVLMARSEEVGNAEEVLEIIKLPTEDANPATPGTGVTT